MKNKEKNKSDVKQVLKKQVSTDEYLATLNTEINSFWST